MLLPPLRSALAAFLLVVVAAGCSGARVTLAVPTLVIPAQSTAGTVCYARGEAAPSLQIQTASYRANARYESEGALLETSDEVEVRVYGRSTAPVGTCAALGDDDLELGGPFLLELGEARAVVIGDGDAAQTLAQLVNGGDYWLGVALDAGFSLGGSRRIVFDDARVTLGF